jgi:CBS domain-containing protein
VLAPLLLIGGALGGLEATFLPNEGIGFWPLVSMGAVLGGTMRSPFTGVIFASELTHDVSVLLPLFLAVTISHAVTVLTMRRSILTEKVSRRGYHLSREYAVDPLEIFFVRDVMEAEPLTFSAATTRETIDSKLRNGNSHHQLLYPVMDTEEHMIGVVARSDLERWAREQSPDNGCAPLTDILRSQPITAYPDEPLRVVANRMAERGLTQLPVVVRGEPARLAGLLSLEDLQTARLRGLEEEGRRERVLRLRFFRKHNLPGAGASQ